MESRMLFFRTIRFVQYLLFSRHRKGHGIHSPFIFDVTRDLFRNKTATRFVITIENIRKRNISDQRIIEVTDLGGGSSRMKNRFRKVSDIAKNSAIPEKYGHLLTEMSAKFGKPVVVEFGTSLGISTMYLAAGCPEVPVYTMEGCPRTSELATDNFRASGFQNISLLNGPFDEMIIVIKEKRLSPGLVFIYGDHRKQPLCNYFRQMVEISDNETVIIIDDIHSSPEMEEAWDEIKKYENVSSTIDLFRMGIVFFRKGLSPVNYVIRY